MTNHNQIKKELAKRDGLRCAITGDVVASIDELEIEHLVPTSMGGTNDLGNLVLVKPKVNRMILDADRQRTKMLVEQLRQGQEEVAKRERDTFEREKLFRKQFEEREQANSKELDAQHRRLKEQEVQLLSRIRSNEDEFARRFAELEEQRSTLNFEIQERETQLQLSQKELEKEKARYTEEARKQVESNAATYVNDALTSLELSVTKYRSASKNWALVGIASLALGVFFAAYFSLQGLSEISMTNSMDWPYVTYFAFKGLVLIGLLVALAKYCFIYSQSFMHESLKNSERKHAIKFGKFYLESYGANADWSQIREAFEHWNIAPASAFSANNPDKFDPHVIERVAHFLDNATKNGFLKPPLPDASKRV